ncbi:MAG: 6-carboxytetrahydropterin synthase QueD [Robiginitomaculum sp.]|nr:MAG: 6-carboxytetrahydropterin synthase QueD [Robiginitomaculum sp.]
MQANIILSKTFTFEAAHSLDLKDGTDLGYKRLHGHSFTATLSIKGPKSEIDDWLMDFGSFAPTIEQLKDKLDHAFLNELVGLKSPTLENMCAYIFDLASKSLPNLFAVDIARITCGQNCRLEIG